MVSLVLKVATVASILSVMLWPVSCSCSAPVSSGMVGWLRDLLECFRWPELSRLTGELWVARLGSGEVELTLQGGEHSGEMLVFL